MEVNITFNENSKYAVGISVEITENNSENVELELTYKEAMHLAGVLIARLFEQSKKSTDSFFKDEFPYWR